MRDAAKDKLIRLSDYTPPGWLAETVSLTFRLHPEQTRVRSEVRFVPNPEYPENRADLALDGRELKLISAAIDGEPVPPGNLEVGPEGLSMSAEDLPEGPFTWACETESDPSSNTALEGLYMSKGMYCTQCEAQGFRKITFFPDRPDVMARYSVRIEGDAPVLLSNGNLVAAGDGWAEWQDPWPKPSYLFALVAGDLVSHDDTFTTCSGRQVTLKIHVRPGDEGKCAYAMDALKRAMKWDEENYGREYDLDLFMIVAVDDFNMGAMENKGLNIFNSKYVLASPETATDLDYKLIEGIIAHEYFHNWTGNRITCRDWFQLCLKEGLTVFRDQQFSGDQRSRAVKRIEDVLMLRSRQFREDAGPLAHPVRPEEYIEINNFYTATVYEKGAEVIRMLRLLVGEEAYREALDLYFERHDGQACTIEDWLKVFEDTTGRDLSQFALWYSQAGTPTVSVSEDYSDGLYTLTFHQRTPATPGRKEKKTLVIPVAYGFLARDGSALGRAGVLELTRQEQSFTFPLPEPPVPSLMRGFSAPVNLERESSADERAFLLAHDTDPFNKWEAGRAYALELMSEMSRDLTRRSDPALLDSLHRVSTDDRLDPAFRALALGLPPEDDIARAIAEAGGIPDPDAIHAARRRLETALARQMQADLPVLYDAMTVEGHYSPDAGNAGKRALRARALELLTRLDNEAALARKQFETADNMTEQLSALTTLVRAGKGNAALSAYYEQWREERLVIDKWFSVQAANAEPAEALDVVEGLARHRDFDWKNPNRFRALIATYAVSNPAGFHRADGRGYAFLADWVIRIDPINPMTAARLCSAFETWRRYDEGRREHAVSAIRRIAETADLSKDTSEISHRILEP
ncbi:MAG: aminopeptidase N [Paracoccaceae bacterium]